MTGFINNLTLNNIDSARLQSETQSLNSVKDSLSANNPNKAKLTEAAQQFESVFINQILQMMDQTVERSEFMNGGQGEKVFRGMFYQEVAKNIAKSPNCNLGVGKLVYDQLAKYQ